MTQDVIKRAREGVEKRRYSLTELARLSDIPLTTLQTMLEPDWGKRVFGAINNLERLQCSMQIIDRDKQKRERA